MLIIKNSYNQKCSFGSLASIARQSLNNMLESYILALKNTLLTSVKLHLSCTVPHNYGHGLLRISVKILFIFPFGSWRYQVVIVVIPSGGC